MPDIAMLEAKQGAGFWRRHAWKFLFGLVIVIGLFGVGDIIGGLDADPAIPAGITGMTPDEIRVESESVARLADLQVRSGGVHLVVMSLLWAVVLLVPFRRRERWAWYVMWTFPLWAMSVSASFLFIGLQPDQPLPPPAISGWVFMALTALLLLACQRDFAAAPRPETQDE